MEKINNGDRIVKSRTEKERKRRISDFLSKIAFLLRPEGGKSLTQEGTAEEAHNTLAKLGKPAINFLRNQSPSKGIYQN
jgi:hypothetical protein